MPEAFGPLLQALLEERRLSVPAFSTKVSYHRSLVGYVIRGQRRPPLDEAGRWAEVLGLTGHRRDEFLLSAAWEHTPSLIQKAFRELEEQARRRR